MTDSKQWRYSPVSSHWVGIIGSGVVLVALLIIRWQVDEWYKTHLLAEEHADVQRRLIPYGNVLTTGINQRFAQLEGLAAFAQAYPTRDDLDTNFMAFAAGLYTGKDGFRAIQIFPKDGTVYVYPTSGNEAVLGHTLDDLINDEQPDIRADVQRAIETRQIATSGPYELRQGGLGFVAWLAVYQNDALWGLAVIVLDMPPLLNEAGVDVPPEGTELALRDSAGQVFVGKTSVFSADPVIYQVDLPEGAWTLAMIPAGGWQSAIRDLLTVSRIVGLVIVGLVSGLVYLTITRQARLARVVRERTTALAESQARYQTLFDSNSDALFVLDSQGHIVDVNHSAYRCYGYDRAELLEMAATDLSTPDLRDKVSDRIAEALAVQTQFEWRHRRVDGSEFPVEISAQPFLLGNQPHILSSVRDISERKRAEKSLHESEERYHSIVSNLPNGLIHIFDRDIRYVFNDGEGMKKLGLTNEMLAGKTIHDMLDPDMAKMVEEHYRRALSGKTVQFEGGYADRTFLVSAVPLRDPNGEIHQILALSIDITERKRMEQALRDNESFLNSIIEQSPNAIWISDDKGTLLRLNQACRDLLNIKDEEVVGKYNVFQDEIVQNRGLVPLIESVFSQGKLVRFDLEYDSSQLAHLQLEKTVSVILDVTIFPIKDATGKTTNAVIQHIDITERKQTQEALSESEERYRLLVDQSPYAIGVHQDGTLVFANSAAVRLLGAESVDDLIGKSIRDIVHPDTWEATRGRISRMLQGESGLYSIEGRYVRLDGSEFPVEVTATPFMYRGRPAIQVIALDITERKQAEKQIKKLNRTYLVISKINRAIIQIREMQILFDTVCKIAVEDGGFRMAWVGLLDAETGRVNPVAHVGIENGYLEKLRITLDDKKRGQGPTGKSLLLGQHVVSNDIANDPRMLPWREDALQRGYRASAAFPLNISGETRGSFNLYIGDVGFFDDDELELLDELAEDISFAMKVSEKEAQRKQIEDVLRKLSARESAILAAVPDIIIEVDNDKVYTWANQAGLEFFGEDVIGKEAAFYFEGEQDTYDAVKSLFNGAENVIYVESWQRRKDGQKRLLAWWCQVLKDEKGAITGTLSSARDITERKQAQETLFQQSKQLKTLYTLSSYFNMDLQYPRVIELILEEISQIESSDLAWLFLYEEDPQYITSALRNQNLHDVGKLNQCEGEFLYRLVVQSGHTLYFPDICTNAQSIYNEYWQAGLRSLVALPLSIDQKIVGILGLASSKESKYDSIADFLETVVDLISKGIYNIQLREQALSHLSALLAVHKTAQRLQALRTPNDLVQEIIRVLEQILEYEYSAVLLIDPESRQLIPFVLSEQGKDTVYVLEDKAFIASLGIHVGQGITGKVAQTGESIRLHDVTQDPDYFAVRESIHSELCVPLKIGEQVVGVVNVESTRYGLYTERDQQVLETIAAQMAIAIQNAQLLDKVRHHTDELEQRVIERTTQLEAKNRELETFTYSVSHDLKAPLRGIDGYSRLLLEDYLDQLDDKGRTFLHSIRHATTQMNQLIDDLLVYSRMERRKLSAAQINPAVVIQTLIAEYADEAQAQGITIITDVPDTSISSDSEGLTMALRNLIENAFKFTRKTDSPVVEIGGRETDTSCILWVRDNGIGFDMQYHDRIFEIFQRLHRAEDYVGTGVGLAIVRKAIERMGGRVWAESELEHGATFYLEIPR